MAPKIEEARHQRPTDRGKLWRWLKSYTGVGIPHQAVCEGHTAPLDMLAEQVLERPPVALWHGPRGGGKSFMSSIDTHLVSRFNERHGTRILGGSKAQSEQIYGALSEAVMDGKGALGSDADQFKSLLKQEAVYENGSRVSILAASSTSVRGPHVPSLKLDEVDEIDEDIRESAMGMAMEIRGQRSNVLMTSTWHRVAGPMSELIERGQSGKFPVRSFCVWEVLKRCEEERSGPSLEKCPDCPLVKWCHADRDSHPSGLPKAKRSRGHYSIDALIQKLMVISIRVFESDYLCKGPRADGVWFKEFDDENISSRIEYDPRIPLHVSIDSGVWTGAVFFQVVQVGGRDRIHVLLDYLKFDIGAESAAWEIVGLLQNVFPFAWQNRRMLRVSTDSAGGSRNPIGPTVIAEYEKAGLKGKNGIEHWPRFAGSVLDQLGLLEGFVRSADGFIGLLVRPECTAITNAMRSFARMKRAGQWLNQPKPEDHPHEEMVDSLRGGLKVEFPESRRPKPNFARVHSSRFL